jgi:acyl-CoA synthetase (NDP forming)
MSREPARLDALFDPRTIAILGASSDAAKWGGDLAARLTRTERRRPLYFVNTKGRTMHGRQAYRSLFDLPESPDLVVLAIPAQGFEKALDEALQCGARALVAVFAGLGETGDRGKARERAAVERVRAAGAVMIGPNCMGLADTSTGLQVAAYLDIPEGGIGFISQSGGIGEELVTRALECGVGFSRYVTLGNQADVEAHEVLRGFVDHEPTRVVGLYVEDLRDGREFARAARAVVASGRPVVLLAPGRSEAGVRSARSHTGSLAPDAAVLDALCRAAGVVRVSTQGQLFETLLCLNAGRSPAGRRVTIVSDGGGHGGLAGDAAVAAGLEVRPLGGRTLARVRKALPESDGCNPIDFALGTINPDAYGKVVEVLAAAADVDAVLTAGQFGYWGARFAQFAERVALEAESARRMADAASRTGTPVVVCTAYPTTAAASVLRRRGVPVYREIEAAVGALTRLVEAAEGEARVGDEAARSRDPIPALPAIPERQAPVRDSGYEAARGALAAHGLPFAEAAIVHTPDEALSAAADLGYPVVLKALGRLHKSDEGGVALGLGDGPALASAYEGMAARLAPSAFSVECMAPLDPGVELIIGSRWDAHAGPVILVGLGGLHAELLADRQLALAPTDEALAEELIRSLRAAPLLTGARGRRPLDVAAAARAAAALSRFAAAHPEVAEVEVNPLLVMRDGAIGLDARIVLA